MEILHTFHNVTSKIEKYQSNNLEIENEVPQGYLYLEFYSSILNIEPYGNLKFYVNDVRKFKQEINVTI